MHREELHGSDLMAQIQQAMGGMYNPGTRMPMEKADQLYEALKNENEMIQLEAATELCNYFSVGTESSVSSIKLDRLVPEFLNLLRKDHNVDLMLLSARALTHMIDCVPGSGSLVVGGGGIALLNEKLLNIAYIDLAEQCLFVLDHLIRQHGQNLIREGSLMAILAFIDFFSIDIQRKIANMAAYMCKRIPSNCFANVECVLPNIVNLLSSHDARVVENACRCINNIASCFAHDCDKLEKVCTEQVITVFMNQLSNNLDDTNKSTISAVIGTLVIAASSSAKATHMLHTKGIAAMISLLISGEPSNNNSSSTKNVAQETILEILHFSSELIPRVNIPDYLVTEMPISKRRDLFQRSVAPVMASVAQSPSSGNHPFARPPFTSSNNAKCKLFEENPALMFSFAEHMLPSLLHIYSSSVHSTVRQRCLSIVCTILYYATADTLKEVLMNIPFSTWLCNTISSNEMVSVAQGICMANILMQKLPQIFTLYFVREGVVNQIQKLSGRKAGSEEPTLQQIMTLFVKDEYEKAEKVYKENVEKIKREAENQQEKQPQGDESEQPNVEQQELTLHEMLQTIASHKSMNQQEAPPPFPQQVKREEKKQAQKKKETIAPFNPPTVQPPPVPLTSRLFKIEKNSVQSPELIEYVVSQAQQFQITYFDQDLGKFSSPTVAKLAKLGEELKLFVDEPMAEDEEQVLKSIRETLASDEGVSNYELMNSHIFHSLLVYLSSLSQTSKTPLDDRLARVFRFCSTFDRVMDTEQKRSNSPLSHSHSPSRQRFVNPRKITHFADLVRKVQSCFTATENLPILVTDASANPMNCVMNALSLINRHIKLDIKSQENSNVILRVQIAPLCSVGSLFSAKIPERLFEKIKEKQDKAQEKQVAATKQEEQENVEQKEAERVEEEHIEEEEIKEDEEQQQQQEEEERDDESNEVFQAMNSSAEFSLDDADNEDENSLINATREPVIQVPPQAPMSKLSILLEQLKPIADGSGSGESSQYEFVLDNDHVLENDKTLYHAIATSQGCIHEHPSQAKIWDTVTTLYLRERKTKAKQDEQHVSTANTTAPSPPLCTFDEREGASSMFNFHIDNRQIFSDLDKDAAENLELLRLLFIFSTKAKYLPHLANAKQERLINSSDFRNGKLISKLSRQLHDPYVTFMGCLPQWCFDMVRACPFLFSFQLRMEFFKLTSIGVARAINTIQNEYIGNMEHRPRHMRIARINKQKLCVNREQILQNAIFVLNKHGTSKNVLEFEFENEVGTGQGPTLEFYTIVSREFQLSELNMWREDSVGSSKEPDEVLVRASSGLFPKPIHPTQSAQLEENLFRLLGLFVARALYDNRLVDLPFSNGFLKMLRGDVLSLNDMQYVDPVMFAQLDKLRKLVTKKHRIERQQGLSDEQRREAIEAITLSDQSKIADLCLDFLLPGTVDPVYELEPCGASKSVTIWNLEKWLDLVTLHMLREGVKRQVEAFKRGFDSLIPTHVFKLFGIQELSEMMSGCDEKWSEQLLVENTQCDHGFTHKSKPVQHLFHVLLEMNREQKRAFLKFVTGCPKLPPGGLVNLRPKLTIVRKMAESGKSASDEYLPSVMTCTNYLKLPDYSSVEVLKRQLFKAMEEGHAFLLS